jgi:hypothetical protein
VRASASIIQIPSWAGLHKLPVAPLALAQRLLGAAAVVDVLHVDGQALGRGESAGVDPSPARRGDCLEAHRHLLGHRTAVVELELRADEPGKGLPYGFAEQVLASPAVHLFERAVDVGEAPLAVDGGERIVDALQPLGGALFRAIALGKGRLGLAAGPSGQAAHGDDHGAHHAEEHEARHVLPRRHVEVMDDQAQRDLAENRGRDAGDRSAPQRGADHGEVREAERAAANDAGVGQAYDNARPQREHGQHRHRADGHAARGADERPAPLEPLRGWDAHVHGAGSLRRS